MTTRTIALDVEVADTRVSGSLCAVGVCVIEGSHVAEEFYTLCNPGVPFDAFCVRVHGITEEMVQDAPELATVLTMLTPYLENSLMVAHNAPFDAGQLRAAARRTGVALPQFQTCCTVRLARKVFPGRRSYKLSQLQDLIGMPFAHHNALWDARACAQVYLRCQQEQARQTRVQQMSMDFKALFTQRRNGQPVQSSLLTDGTFGGFGFSRPRCSPSTQSGPCEKERSNIMKTKAVRMYGVNDLRLEEFELPEIKDDEILAKIITDSVCMSSYKAAIQGSNHKRVPDDIDVNPVIIGHEFAGVIEKVGKKWQEEWKPGDPFAIQPALNLPGDFHTPGYSYPYFGGDMTYCVIPKEVMEQNCLLHYEGKGFFNASLGEPMSCIIGASHATYHTKPGVYVHEMGIKKNGTMALLACAGPMGLGAIDYAMHADIHPRLMAIVDINADRLARAEKLFREKAEKRGIEIHFINTQGMENPKAELLKLTDGKGFDDVLCYAPVRPVVELGDSILGTDGCLNFFAGPVDKQFSAMFNFYNVHYAATHVVGTSGGNTDDLIESLTMTAQGRITPGVMITHVGGIDAVVETTLNLPNIPGGKKLIYPGINMPLTAIDDFEALGKTDPFFAELDALCKKHNGLWNHEAEAYILEQKSENY